MYWDSKYPEFRMKTTEIREKAFFFCGFSLFCAPLFSQTNHTDAKPNIVLIVSDDQGWADVGWHGKDIRTPVLDGLVSEGMRLEQFYVQPASSPTRAALMTGRYPMRYGLQVGVIRPFSDYGLPLGERTLGEAMKDAGYFTAICGKWHLGESKKEYLPNQRGFDHHYGHYLGAIDYYTHSREGGLDWHRNGKHFKEEGYSTDLLADESVRLIRNHNYEKPLFLCITFNAVHNPYQESPHKEINALYSQFTNKTRRIYAGMVTSMDAAVGRVLQAIEEKGIKDNTIIFFCSDNGGPEPGVVTDNGYLRSGKGFLYEGGLRVPAVIVWPGKIKAGTVSNNLMHVVDLYPTFLSFAGAPLEQKNPLDGKNMKDALLDGRESPDREVLLNASPCTGAFRKGNWKIVLNGSVGDNAMPKDKLMTDRSSHPDVELFDLSKDPGEKNNLASLYPEKVKELMEFYWHYAEQAVPYLNKNRPDNLNSPKIWGYFD